jgi:hypothetical protein
VVSEDLTTPIGVVRAAQGANANWARVGRHFEAGAVNEGLTTPTGAVRARRGRAYVKMGECGGHFWAPAVK